MKFDVSLSSDPLASTIVAEEIESAELRFWVEEVFGEGRVRLHYRVNAPWDEATLIYKRHPFAQYSDNQSISILWSSVQQFYHVDVTDAVKDWVDDPGINNGIFFWGDRNRGMRIASKENSDSSHHPVIIVRMETGTKYMLGSCTGSLCNYCEPGWIQVNEIEVGVTQRIGLCKQ